MRIGRILWLALLVVALGAACKKQTSAPADPVQAYQHLPDAATVLTALNQTNYDEVVSGMAKMRASLTTEEQEAEYSVLSRQVKDKLLEAQANDPKAAEAMQVFRLMATGR